MVGRSTDSPSDAVLRGPIALPRGRYVAVADWLSLPTRGHPQGRATGSSVVAEAAHSGRISEFLHDTGDDAAKPLPVVVSLDRLHASNIAWSTYPCPGTQIPNFGGDA